MVCYFGGEGSGGFRSSKNSEFQISEFQVSEFGVPSFGIPQCRSSNFSTHKFDCSGGSGVGKHYKNNGLGIPELRSFGFPGFRVVRPRFFPDLGFSELQVSELLMSELQFSEFQISELQVSEFLIISFFSTRYM